MLLLSRDEAYQVRKLITVAPITTRVRGIPVEVAIGPKDGMPRDCVINLDTVTTIPKDVLTERLTQLSKDRVAAADRALKFALGLDQ